MPNDVTVGSSEHLRFLTLPRVIWGLYGEVELWQRAGALWADPETRWLFDTAQVAYADWRAVEAALGTQRLAERRQDVRGWYEVARGLQGRFKGEVRGLIEAGGARTSTILAYLEQHRTTFPLLSGPETARRWLDQLGRVGGVAIEEDEALRLAPSEEARAALEEGGLALPDPTLPVQQVLALEVWAGLGTEAHQEVLQAIQ